MSQGTNHIALFENEGKYGLIVLVDTLKDCSPKATFFDVLYIMLKAEV